MRGQNKPSEHVQEFSQLGDIAEGRRGILWYDDIEQCFSTAGPRPGTGPGINYTGPREVLLEFVILFF